MGEKRRLLSKSIVLFLRCHTTSRLQNLFGQLDPLSLHFFSLFDSKVRRKEVPHLIWVNQTHFESIPAVKEAWLQIFFFLNQIVKYLDLRFILLLYS